MSGLARRLAARDRRQMSGERRAAVLVPWVEDGGAPRLILTRRTEELTSHSGQVAFPGGRIDPEDLDAVAAALREADEEIGLPPSAVEVLGCLDDFPTVSGTTIVTPILGRLRQVPPLTPAPSEVARIFEIPLSALRIRERWRVQRMRWRGTDWPVYFFDHDGETLWGLSAYITLQFLALTPEGGPFPLAEVSEV